MRKPVFKLLYPFEIPALIYALVGLLVARHNGIPINWGVAVDFSFDLLILREVLRYSFVLLLVLYLHRVFHKGGDRKAVLRELRDGAIQWLRPWRDWRRWIELARALFAIKVVVLVHTHLKQAIPIINPVLYDAPLWEIDRVVHLGIDPVRLHLKLFSAKYVTLAIDALYVFWYTVKVIFLVYFLFFAAPRRAWHFLTVYLLLWAVGGGFAVAFPSLGPCYTNPELFANLDLHFADGLQLRLWENYQAVFLNANAYEVQVYEGIAAFPSLHVGFVALFAISMWPHRRIFWVMVAYLVLIQIGSVHLGWHYAVDGYFAILLVLGMWFGLAPLFKEPASTPPGEDPAGTDPPKPSHPESATAESSASASNDAADDPGSAE